MTKLKTLALSLAFSLLLPVPQAWPGSVIFNGASVKALKSGINLGGVESILSGTSDPSAVAISAPKGSLYLRNVAGGKLYQKNDDGSSTNWGVVPTSVSSPLSLTGNAIGCPSSSASQAGCTSSADWIRFDGKVAWYTSTSIPSNGEGNGGDFHLNSTSEIIYRKTIPMTDAQINALSGLVLRVRGDDITLGAGSNVASWHDESVSATNLTQTTPANQGVQITGLNGRLGVRMNGSTSFYTVASPVKSLTTYTQVWVSKMALSSSSGYVIDSAVSGINHAVYASGSTIQDWSGQGTYLNPEDAVGHVYVKTYNTAATPNSALYLDGAPVGVGHTYGVPDGNNLVIGAQATSVPGAVSFPSAVDFYDVIEVNRVLTSGEINDLVLGLANRYGITDTAIWQNIAQLADIKSDGSVPFAADESLGSHKLTNLAAPAAGTDGVNKTYADALIPLTTKGDVFGYSTVKARIPVGSNGQVLTADSTQSLGLKWATPATGVAWGAITGTLSDQTDLQSALDAKLSLSGGTMAGDITLNGNNLIYVSNLTAPSATAGTDHSAPDLAIKSGNSTGAGTSMLSVWLTPNNVATGAGFNVPKKMLLISNQGDGIAADGDLIQLNPPDDANNDANPASELDINGGNKTNGTGDAGGVGINCGNSSGGNGGPCILSSGTGAGGDPIAQIRMTGAGATANNPGSITFQGNLLSIGAAPTITAGCGVGASLVAGSTDTRGVLNVGTGGVATSCTITFHTPKTSVPGCFPNDQTEFIVPKFVPSTTTLVVSKATPFAASSLIDYWCIQ